jgi:RNA polymerase sigma-70 factor (ECF subfamily)
MSAEVRNAGTHQADLALAARLKDRDADAARELFQSLGEEMMGFASRMLQDRNAAEDVFQEAMLGSLQSIGHYDGRVSLRAWMYGILRNKIADAFRKRGRDAVVSNADPEDAQFRADGHWKDSARFSPFNENAEMLDVVRECMDALPHNQKEVLTLRAIEGLSSEEAAQALDLTNTNLRQVLHRARQNVRKCVDGKMGGPPA